MVADVYSHIIDDDRRMNAQRFEETFYAPKNEDAGKEQEKAADSAQEVRSGAFDEAVGEAGDGGVAENISKRVIKT